MTLKQRALIEQDIIDSDGPQELKRMREASYLGIKVVLNPETGRDEYIEYKQSEKNAMENYDYYLVRWARQNDCPVGWFQWWDD